MLWNDTERSLVPSERLVMTSISTRDALILRIVRDGDGKLGSRQIDIRYSQRMAHTGEQVFDTLDRLEKTFLLVRHTTPGSPFDRYEITPLGSRMLEEGSP